MPDLRGQLYFEGAYCLELAALGLGFEDETTSRGFELVAEVPHHRHEHCLVLAQVVTWPGSVTGLEARLERNYRRLSLGLRRPVMPVVVHLSERPRMGALAGKTRGRKSRSAGLDRRCLVRGDAGVELFRLDYRSVDLSAARAECHLGRSRLAPALASRMCSAVWSPAELQLECMAAVLASELRAEWQELLLRAIEAPRV